MMAGPAVHFVALRDFEEIVNGCLNRYAAGMHYHARPGNTWDDLRSKIPLWESRKMIAVGLHAQAHLFATSIPIARGRAAVIPRS